jgi:hypothetical protein
MAELIKRQLVYRPELGLGASAELVRDYVIGQDARWKDGVLELQFQGNRVDLLPSAGSGGTGTVDVFIDGKRPSEFPGCYAYTRPSVGHGTWGPGIMRVTFRQRPLIEDWRARVTHFDRQTEVFRFEVIGSQTGADGEGVSTEDFVSSSGRVVIQARVTPPGVPEQTDWRMHGVIPVGYEVKWRTIGLFHDRYQPPAITDRAREHATTVAQGFPNGKHTLTLRSDVRGRPALDAIRVYRPPLKSE